MSISTLNPAAVDDGEQRLVVGRLGWDQYLAISDALGESSGVRSKYRKGRLTLLTKSRRHEWSTRRLARLIQAVASGCGILWEDAGESTYRRKDLEIGLEADEAFYFGEHARLMRGPKDVDLSAQPPPDLAIETEVTHGADDSMAIYAELGVPEVWRFDVLKWAISFNRLQPDGTYKPEDRSVYLPLLRGADVLDQIRLAEDLGSAPWAEQLRDWVRDVILPRLEQNM